MRRWRGHAPPPASTALTSASEWTRLGAAPEALTSAFPELPIVVLTGNRRRGHGAGGRGRGGRGLPRQATCRRGLDHPRGPLRARSQIGRGRARHTAAQLAAAEKLARKWGWDLETNAVRPGRLCRIYGLDPNASRATSPRFTWYTRAIARPSSGRSRARPTGSNSRSSTGSCAPTARRGRSRRSARSAATKPGRRPACSRSAST